MIVVPFTSAHAKSVLAFQIWHVQNARMFDRLGSAMTSPQTAVAGAGLPLPLPVSILRAVPNSVAHSVSAPLSLTA